MGNEWSFVLLSEFLLMNDLVSTVFMFPEGDGNPNSMLVE